jgi:hypothetical protein
MGLMMVGRQRQYNKATSITSILFYTISGGAQHKQTHNSWGDVELIHDKAPVTASVVWGKIKYAT